MSNISNHISSNDESVKERTELFYKYIMPNKGLVYSICIKHTFNKEDTEDNYNDAMVNFFKYIKSYDPIRSLKSWMYSVTQRNVIGQYKRSNRMTKDDYIDIYSIPDTVPYDSDKCFTCMGIDNYKECYNDDILNALDQLTPIHKEALLLQQAGYTINEIMEIAYKNGSLNSRNLETTKSRIFFAKQQMSRLITSNGEKRYD